MGLPLRTALETPQDWEAFRAWLWDLYDYTGTIRPNAELSALLAKQWASKLDGPVVDGLFSARWNAGLSRDWASKLGGPVVDGLRSARSYRDDIVTALAGQTSLFCGVGDTLPLTRPDDSPLQPADLFFLQADDAPQQIYVFASGVWLAIAGLDMLLLASSAGAYSIGFGSRSVAAKLSDFRSVLDKGAKGDGATDDSPAFQATRFLSDRIYFPLVNGAPTIYYLGAVPVEMVSGTIWRADPGVTLSLPTGQNYALFDNVTFDSDVEVTFRDSQTNHFFFAKTVSAHKKDWLAPPPLALRRNRIALDCTDPRLVNRRRVGWPNSDVFTEAVGSVATDRVSIGLGNGTSFTGAFVETGVYETVSAFFDGGLFSDPLGLMIRGSLGFGVLYNGTSEGDYNYQIKLAGQPVGDAQMIPWDDLGQHVFTSYSPQLSGWSASKINAFQVLVKLNGKGLGILAGVGEVFEIGFVRFANAAFDVAALTIERRIDAAVGMPKLREIRIFGDSTADEFPSSWSKLIRPLLDSTYGVKLDLVTNFAVNGDNLTQQYVSLTQNGTGKARYVVFCCGTNDIQGLQDIATFKTTVLTIVNEVKNRGLVPVFMIPWLWYTQAQSGGAGQGSANYDKGAPYRQWMEYICMREGAVVVKLGEELPLADPRLITSDPKAKLLRDNIHQDMYGHQLYAQALASAIVSHYMSLPDSVEEPLTPFLRGPSTGVVNLRACYGKDGQATINGTLTAPGVAHGDVLFRIPRHLLPTYATDIMVLPLDGSLLPITGGAGCWVSLNPVTGMATIQRPPAGTASIILGSASWKTQASVVGS